MSRKKRFGVSEALSRGLSETIHVVENNSGIFRNVILPLSRIELDPDNPRKLAVSITDVRHGIPKDDPLLAQKTGELEKLKELAATIEANGVINPVVVYKRGEVYRIVAGERRCLASILAGKPEIEARVFNEKPGGYELKLVQWVENTAREDLTLYERMENIRDILHEYQNQKGQTAVSASLLKTITGLSLSQASYYVAVLQAPEDVREAIQKGEIKNLDKAALLSGISSEPLRESVLQACIRGCTLKELKNMLARKKSPQDLAVPSDSGKKRGRVLTRINMGSTHNAKVIQTIIFSVLQQAELARFADQFSRVHWNHYDQAAQAFRKMIHILETEFLR